MASTDRRRAHVVLFPFMAQGHIAPFLSLANLIRRARPDHALVTMVATPAVANSLSTTLAADGVRVHALPFDDPPADDLIALFLASESLLPAFRHFLAGLMASDPTAHVQVIADMFLAGWALAAARDAGAASHSAVLTTGAYGSAVYFSLWNSVPLIPATTSSTDGELLFRLPDFFPDVDVRRSQLTDHLAGADGTDAWSTFISKQIAAFHNTDALLVNTAEDLEPKGMLMLRQLFNNVPVYPVGPLLLGPTAALSSPSSPAPGTKRNAILSWLDRQPPCSVLYVSFGSQYTIGTSQMFELAMGLEISKHKFLWVIRPPAGHDVNGEFRPEWLPEGFRERVEASGRGIVARCWAPQAEILAHAATGAFLTHCGWNSVQEGLANGVPLIGWPLSAEQFYNAKVLVEEMGVCVEVARGMHATVGSGEVAAAVEMVLGDTVEGGEMRRKAAEMKEVIAAARGIIVTGAMGRRSKWCKGCSPTLCIVDVTNVHVTHAHTENMFMHYGTYQWQGCVYDE
ncbi:hypothetical protein HU200_052391 [Digitaria exilis]|uniref:Glycosyltransferase n=1 Tax=Digitaria exilis TaxID=1010633 RepID=A0A835E8S3_9POAL|nr:hypothetical protein HU200_052391 [Digitaria exilis]